MRRRRGLRFAAATRVKRPFASVRFGLILLAERFGFRFDVIQLVLKFLASIFHHFSPDDLHVHQQFLVRRTCRSGVRACRQRCRDGSLERGKARRELCKRRANTDRERHSTRATVCRCPSNAVRCARNPCPCWLSDATTGRQVFCAFPWIETYERVSTDATTVPVPQTREAAAPDSQLGRVEEVMRIESGGYG